MIRRLTPTERFKRSLVRVVYVLSRPNTYSLLALILAVVLVAGTFITWVLELQPGGEPGLQSADGSFTFMLQNVAGVGLGAKSPQTIWGRVAGVFFVLFGAGMRGVLLAAIVSGFVNNFLAQGKGVKRVKMQRHVIICGWNTQVKQVIEVLQREAFGAGVPIVLLAPLPQNPYPEKNVKFVSGSPSDAADLERAGVGTAQAAIVVTDESDRSPHHDSTFDARAVLTVLALKAANTKLHVVAQMRDPANRPHFERARADDVIASAEMSEGLLARSALNIGIANVFADLLRLDTPEEMFIVNAPLDLEGKTFQAALIHYQLRFGQILIGVIEGGDTILCPPSAYKIHRGVRLVVLGNIRPALTP